MREVSHTSISASNLPLPARSTVGEMNCDQRIEEVGLLLMIAVSVLMTIVALVIPLRIIIEYGFSSGPLYRRDGSIAAQVTPGDGMHHGFWRHGQETNGCG
jgi:hypothetical protein